MNTGDNDKKNTDWNPQLYLKFKDERTQPSIDLAARINIDSPERIIDIGCGSGNSTQVLCSRWPGSRVTGLDNSPAMIEKAKQDFPSQEWILSDPSYLSSGLKFDIVFSNAVIQWIPYHEQLIPLLFNSVKDNGALAVQIPIFRDMPLGKSIEKIADNPEWRDYTAGCSGLFTYHDYNFYYDILAERSGRIDIWETHYIHILDSDESVLEWIRSTGLKPYLDRLKDDGMKDKFTAAVLEEIRKNYPLQRNGKVLFPFKRLFFIAYRQD